MKEPALVLFDPRDNRNSVTALVTALEVEGLDRRYGIRLEQTPAAFARALRETEAEGRLAVGGVSYFTSQAGLAEKVLGEAKRQNGDNAFLIAGGPHPSGDPESALRAGFHAAVTGEGEKTLLELLRALAEGDDWRSVKGVASLSPSGSVRRGPRQKPIDLDSIPAFSERYMRFGPIEISRGCPFACRYCQTSSHFGTAMRHRSPETVAEGVRILARRGMRDVRFLTPDALAYGSPDGKALHLQSVERLFEETRKAAGEKGRIWFGTFPSELRPEHVSPEAMELIRRYASNRSVVIGAQSGSEAVLERSHRQHGAPDVIRAVDIAVRYGFEPLVDIIFALPGETDADREETLEFCQELTSLGARIHVHHFMPLPGTAWRDTHPEALPAEFVKRVGRLVSEGAFFGDFYEQARLAGGKY